jgi:hypothetical protein
MVIWKASLRDEIPLKGGSKGGEGGTDREFKGARERNSAGRPYVAHLISRDVRVVSSLIASAIDRPPSSSISLSL